MSTKSKIVLLVLAVIAALSLSVFAVSAQDTDPQPEPPFGFMGNGGYGAMMGIGPRMMWDGDTAPMFNAIAEVLGIDPETLLSELQSGKTLAQLAQEKGLDLTELQEKVQAQMQERLQAMVQDGTGTQAQVEAHQGFMGPHMGDAPVTNGQGAGMGGSGAPRGMGGRGH